MLESTNLPSSLLTVPVINAVSFAVLKITFTKGKTVFVALSFIVPETVTVLFCANDVVIEHRMMIHMVITIECFFILILTKNNG